jgi:glycine/D-amino acid oxidase-like deaminating enzyme
MLEQSRALGGKRQKAMVTAIEKSSTFKVTTEGNELQIQTEKIVNAAGPFAGKISRMLDIELPIKNILHQKIAFPDAANAIPRGLPFSIDLDAQHTVAILTSLWFKRLYLLSLVFFFEVHVLSH